MESIYSDAGTKSVLLLCLDVIKFDFQIVKIAQMTTNSQFSFKVCFRLASNFNLLIFWKERGDCRRKQGALDKKYPYIEISLQEFLETFLLLFE